MESPGDDIVDVLAPPDQAHRDRQEDARPGACGCSVEGSVGRLGLVIPQPEFGPRVGQRSPAYRVRRGRWST